MIKYQTIYADPPWQMEFIKREVRPNQVEMPYSTMTVDEICNLGIDLRPYLAENCNLFLWTTHKYLPDAFRVVKEWGFKYHCLITWNKLNGMTFFGFNRRSEFALYAYRGKITIEKTGEAFPTVFDEKLTQHSVKPQRMYELIELKSPAPRLELFARNKRDGWDVWGNEVDSDIEICSQ
jgi:site-specific DNA-methyltransferase (adenine-specific)